MEFDAKVPNTARMWNYWLGGKDNFAPDREAGDRVIDALPTMPMVAWWARRFLADAVRQLATVHGVRQFLDIGSGLPTADNTHEVAQRAVVRRTMDAVPSGSYLVVGHGASDIEPAAAAELSERYNAMSPTKIRLRTRAEILPFFDGLEMTGRGLVPLSQWWDSGPADTDTASGLAGHVGIARKP